MLPSQLVFVNLWGSAWGLMHNRIREGLEAGGGIEPPNTGFAVPCITTLLPSLNLLKTEPMQCTQGYINYAADGQALKHE